MAKFTLSGSFGFGCGGAAANGKKNWLSKLINKISNKQPQNTEEQPQEQAFGKAAGGLGELGFDYNIAMDLSIAEMRELYSLTHSDEEWSFGRTAAEFKALGRGIKDLIWRFIGDEGKTLNAAWDVACMVYEHCKRRDHETCRLDREIELDNFRTRLEQEREMDRLRREDAAIRAAEKAEEEKAAKQK